jgi:hypothetical protein
MMLEAIRAETRVVVAISEEAAISGVAAISAAAIPVAAEGEISKNGSRKPKHAPSIRH